MKYLKTFESIFNQRMGNKLYVEFDSTHDPFVTSTGQVVGSGVFNSMQNFRENYKKITPSETSLSKTIDLMKSILGDKINHHKYFPEYRQLCIYMWSNKEYMTYDEREKSNKKTIIINFYEDDWIFVALIDKNNWIGGEEKHYVCDDLIGLEQFLNDKKEYLINK
jgi:hypothetical protein